MLLALSIFLAGTLCIIGQGLLLLGMAGPTQEAENRHLRIACAPLLGLPTLTFILQLAPNLIIGLMGSVFVSLAGFALYSRFHPKMLIEPRSLSIGSWTMIGIATWVHFWSSFQSPISEWDARSIWFFHAKIIGYSGSLYVPEIWRDPAINWSHVDYPKMLATLAGRASEIAGFWNDYLPKVALPLLILPAIVAVGALSSKSISSCWLWGLMIIGSPTAFHTGYMDQFAAVYIGLGALFVALWWDRPSMEPLLCALGSLAIAAQLKNEGTLGVALCGGLLVVGWRWNRVPLPRGSFLAAGLLVFSGSILWNFLIAQWDLRSIDPLLRAGFTDRILQRGFSATQHIVSLSLLKHRLWIPLTCVVILLGYSRRARAWEPTYLPVILAVLYWAALLLIYLGTPYDLNWHLETSLDRTLLSVRTMLGVAIYLALVRLRSPRETHLQT